MNVSINVISFLEVDELGQTLKLAFEIRRTWFDSQLTMLHLKEDRNLNYLYKENYERIWYPKIYSRNADPSKNNNERYLQYTLLRDMTITPTVRNPGTTNATMEFKGSEHKIERKKNYTYFWRCVYDLKWYPFDLQTCNMWMNMPRHYRDRVRLNPERIEYQGNKAELTEYSVDQILFCSAVNGTELVLSVTLGRPLTGSILIIYIPTLLLLLIRFEYMYISNKRHFNFMFSACSRKCLLMSFQTWWFK